MQVSLYVLLKMTLSYLVHWKRAPSKADGKFFQFVIQQINNIAYFLESIGSTFRLKNSTLMTQRKAGEAVSKFVGT